MRKQKVVTSVKQYKDAGKQLTISIAAYHVEKYLAETLECFLIPEVTNQLEVLIINDGSGEGINEIARKYVEKYPEIFRLIDKENGGHGSTVNRGIQEATGRYFKTVDGDDLVLAEGLAELLAYLETAEEDLVVTDYTCFHDGTKEIVAQGKHDFPGKEYRKTYAFDEISDKVYINMHAAAYRTELLKNMGRQLDEHCFYVDAEYNLYPIPFVETVAFLEKPVYSYRLGMVTQSMDIHNMQRNCAHHEMVLTHLLEFYQGMKDHVTPEKRAYLARGTARILTSQYKIYLSYPAAKEHKNQIRAWDKRVKKEYPEVYRSVANPAVKWLRCSGYLLYPLASRMCRKAYQCD